MQSLLSRLFRKGGKLDELDFQSGLGDSAWLLYGLARSLKPAVSLEIGSARGKSACFIGLALKHNRSGRLYAIDPHCQTNWNDANSIDTFRIMTANLRKAGVSQFVEVVRKTSEEVAKEWNQEIDLLFIDGDHSYTGVKSDWNLFTPHLSEFGVVVFHDTLWDLAPDPRWSRGDMGVPQFVEELRNSGFPVISLNKNFGVSIVQAKAGGIPLCKSE